MTPRRILVATGSSGGHIFPALAFLDELKQKHPGIETLLLLPEKSKQKLRLDDCGHKVKYIALSSLVPRVDAEGARSLLGAVKGTLESLCVLLKFQPEIVVGFGSAASVPAVIFGWLLRAKTVIHEQNVIPGRATRFLAEVVDKIAVSFDDSRAYLKRHQGKIVTTGNPLRRQMAPVEKKEALGYFKFDGDKLTILVMGGSQGSRRINEEFLKALLLMPEKNNLQVIHLSGRDDYNSLKEKYAASGIKFALFDFFGPMNYAYSAADIALSRSGATTVAELASFSLPAILLPYPYAYEHQYRNAMALEEKGCAVIIKDQDISAEVLKEKLEAAASGRMSLKEMRAGYGVLKAGDAAGALVRETLSLN